MYKNFKNKAVATTSVKFVNLAKEQPFLFVGTYNKPRETKKAYYINKKKIASTIIDHKKKLNQSLIFVINTSIFPEATTMAVASNCFSDYR